MANGRHSYVAFYTSDWLAGTARMTRLARSVYHDICLYNWDKNRHVPPGEVKLMLADLPDGGDILEALIESETLHRDDRGGVYSIRAMVEAGKAFDLWERKSAGGKTARRVMEHSSEESSREPEPEPEPSKERDAKASPKKIGSRLPDPFEMPVEWRRWAVNAGMDMGDVTHEATTFTRYWQAKAGRDATKLDWLKTWQNWIDRKLKERPHGSRNRDHPLGRTGSALDTVLAGQTGSDR